MMTRSKQYTHSPWSGAAYEHPPTVDELIRESKDVLRRNPAIAKAMSSEAMDELIKTYRVNAYSKHSNSE
jgi:hypothetical protein